MIKVNREKVEELRGYFEDNIITGINSLEIIKNKIVPKLKVVMDSDKVQSILNKEISISELSDIEIIGLFRVIFNQIKDSNFDPDSIIIEEVKVKASKPKTKKKEKDSKDNSKEKAKEMFRASFKEKFLAEHRFGGKPYSDETKRVVRILFGKTGKIEKHYKKDIANFDKDQFEEVLMSLKASTLRSLQNSISTLEQYIDFSIREGKTSQDKGNIATHYSAGSILSEFLNKKAEENMVFTQAEIDSLSGYAENAQDGVILSLLFDGVSHKRKFVELRNIRIQDCDFNNMVINIPQLVDEDTGEVLPERQVPISSHTRVMIESAMKEDKYVSLKGESKRSYKIAESDYILRGLRDNYQIKWENVSQRIVRISELEGYEYLNATTVSYSGQIHYARELMKNGMSIDEACAEIIKRFNIVETESKSSYYYLKARIEKASQTFAN